MAETFHGYIETTQDVLLIFEGCRRGLIPRVCRRLQEKERRMIRSGSVFVFDERESGIKRWTDGLVWSPSRILGNFLIYRELDKRAPGDKKLSISSASSSDSRQRSYSADQSVMASGMSTDRNRERRLVGSLSDSYRFRKDGLIKKTMSIIVNGVAQHLISYYLPNDIISNKLRTPSSVPELASLEISPDLLVKQNFRIPPMVEPPFDHAEVNMGNSLSPVDTMSGPYANGVDDRRIHPFRSMSMGSLRTSNNYHLSAAGRPDMSNSQQMMYATSNLAQRMDMDDNNPNKLSNSGMSAYYPPMYNNNNNNTNGFAPLPSPSSITSSPMLSPVRQSFSHQQPRHYSMSSSSTSSLPRYVAANRNSFDMMASNSNPLDTNRSVHPHMMPDVNMYGNERLVKTEETTQGFSSSPNIGQLLNPVHPLNSNAVKQEPDSQGQLFQFSNTTCNYSDYHPTPTTTTSSNRLSSFDKLPSLNDNNNSNNNELMQQQPTSFNTYGGNYYIQRQQQQQQPLTNTHSISVTNNIVPMFRNGMVLPQSSSMYDDAQNGPELGMEPLMLK